MSPRALERLKALDPKPRGAIAAAIASLADDPHRGKPLQGVLAGYASIRAVQGRYRVIYLIAADHVEVVAVGARRPGDPKDVYAQLARLLAGGP